MVMSQSSDGEISVGVYFTIRIFVFTLPLRFGMLEVGASKGKHNDCFAQSFQNTRTDQGKEAHED